MRFVASDAWACHCASASILPSPTSVSGCDTIDVVATLLRAVQVLKKICWFVVLAPHGTEQSSMLHSVASDPKLKDLPQYHALLKLFTTMEVHPALPSRALARSAPGGSGPSPRHCLGMGCAGRTYVARRRTCFQFPSLTLLCWASHSQM